MRRHYQVWESLWPPWDNQRRYRGTSREGQDFRFSQEVEAKHFEDSYGRFCSDHVVKPSFPPMPLLPPKGARGRSAWSGSSRRCIRRHFQVRHWLHALRRGVQADTLRMSRDSGRLDSGQDPGRLNGCPPARDLERLEKHWKYQVPGNVPSRSVGSLWNSRRGPFHPELL